MFKCVLDAADALILWLGNNILHSNVEMEQNPSSAAHF
jgi:hypothetical protein